MPMAGFDTPSPVDLDLSMPPPAPPEHFGANSNSTSTSSGSGSGSGLGSSPKFGPTLNEMNFGSIPGEQLLPATPASIMNLGRANTNTLGSTKAQPGYAQAIQIPHQQPIDVSNQSSSSNRDKNVEKARSTKAGAPGDKEKETAGNGRGNQAGNMATIAASRPRRATAGGSSSTNSGLKAILPAGPSDSSAYRNNTSTLSHIEQQNQQQPRKTSHKAAEQKRRDSLKNTFDDLRTLLPPIPLPSEMDESGAGIIPGVPGAWPPRSSSGLPGSLPPRGPPKTGSEGPNKGVSKLQLLICGNEYIRVLRSRVERRDEEIGRLRNEVGNLRALLKDLKLGEGRSDDDAEMVDADFGFDLDLDLERDVDAVELQTHDGGGGGIIGGGGMGTGATSVGAGVGVLESVGEQPDEEDDND